MATEPITPTARAFLDGVMHAENNRSMELKRTKLNVYVKGYRDAIIALRKYPQTECAQTKWGLTQESVTISAIADDLQKELDEVLKDMGLRGDGTW